MSFWILPVSICTLLVSSCGEPAGGVASVPPRQVGEIRVEPIEPEYGRHGWKFTVPGSSSVDPQQTYVIGLTGSPGRGPMVSPEQWEKQRSRWEDQPMLSLRFQSGAVVRVTYDLEWHDGVLALALEVTDRNPPLDGSGGTVVGLRFVPDWSAVRPLDEVRWIGPVDSFDVPDGGIDLVEWGASKNTLRLARDEDWQD